MFNLERGGRDRNVEQNRKCVESKTGPALEGASAGDLVSEFPTATYADNFTLL
jgi:hypothetical protein